MVFDTDKIGGSDLTELFVDDKLAVWKQRKLNCIHFFEIFNFKWGIAHADANEPDLVLLVFRCSEFLHTEH